MNKTWYFFISTFLYINNDQCSYQTMLLFVGFIPSPYSDTHDTLYNTNKAIAMNMAVKHWLTWSYSCAKICHYKKFLITCKGSVLAVCCNLRPELAKLFFIISWISSRRPFPHKMKHLANHLFICIQRSLDIPISYCGCGILILWP